MGRTERKLVFLNDKRRVFFLLLLVPYTFYTFSFRVLLANGPH
jgi:hypothetical protein